MKTDFNLPTAATEIISLDQASPGDELLIENVDVANAGIGQRLLDLGLLPNTPLRVVRRAPLGDPVVYELRGYRLCLRRSEAAHVWVRRAPPPQPPSEATD